MDAQISELLNKIKSNKKEQITDKSSEPKADNGKLDDLMHDIDNEFAELD